MGYITLTSLQGQTIKQRTNNIYRIYKTRWTMPYMSSEGRLDAHRCTEKRIRYGLGCREIMLPVCLVLYSLHSCRSYEPRIHCEIMNKCHLFAFECISTSAQICVRNLDRAIARFLHIRLIRYSWFITIAMNASYVDSNHKTVAYTHTDHLGEIDTNVMKQQTPGAAVPVLPCVFDMLK